jgi:hypothetical protein
VIYTLDGFDAAALLGYRIFNFLSLINVSVLVTVKEATLNRAQDGSTYPD